MGIFLETERLVLREFTADDVDNLVELDADPEVIKWTPDERTTREQVEQHVLPHFRRFYEETPGFGFWAVEEKATGEFIGWFHLRPGEGHGPDEPELGYRLRGSAWGKGYATEGSRALIDKAFSEHPIRRVLAETSAIHIASRRVMEKAGLRLVREFDAGYPPMSPEDVLGDVEYAIDRAEWELQHQSRTDVS
jgi:RimJ/RimL family protein N-acetyltransferase